MDGSLYNDLMGISYDDDLKQTLTQVNFFFGDHQANTMSGSGVYPVEDANTGANLFSQFNPLDLNTTLFDEISLNARMPTGQQQHDLPEDMADVVTNILSDQQHFPLLDNLNSTDLDLGAASLWPDDSLDLESINPDILFSQQTLYQPVSTQSMESEEPILLDSARNTRGRKSAKRNSRTANATLDSTASQYLAPQPPSHEDLRLSTASPFSDASNSADEGSRPRQRRPRVSYDTLTEEQKYYHIRELNNEASRLYRQKNRKAQSQREQEQRSLEEKNRILRAKKEALEKLKNDVQNYIQRVFQQQTQQ